MKQAMLTTIDNPYDPFTQFDLWEGFDEGMGYFTINYLARVAETSPELSDEVNNRIVNDAIDRIIKNDPLPIYVKVISNNINDQYISFDDLTY